MKTSPKHKQNKSHRQELINSSTSTDNVLGEYFLRKLLNISLSAIIICMCVGLGDIRPAHAMQVKPAHVELEGVKGNQQEFSVVVTNTESVRMKVTPEFVKFIPDPDEGGSPKFIEGDLTVSDLPKWLNSTSFELAPNESSKRTVLVNVPEFAAAGTHYGAVMWYSEPIIKDGLGNGVTANVRGKISTLIFVNIPGQIKNDVKLLAADSDRWLWFSLPVSFFLRVENKGNVAVRPGGAALIHNMLGLKTAEIIINPTRSLVLPDSIRKINFSWELENSSERIKPLLTKDDIKNPVSRWYKNYNISIGNELRNFAFGRYSARLALTGIPQGVTKPTITFWVFPWHVSLLGLLILILVSVVLWIIMRARIRAVVGKYSK